MAFYKKLKSDSDAQVVIMGGGDQSKLFPIGFKYMLDETIYTVKKCFNSDNTEWRQLTTDEGDKEDVTVDTMIRDFQSQRRPEPGVGGRPSNIYILHDPDDVANSVLPEAEPPVPVRASAPRKPKAKATAKKAPAKKKTKVKSR
jgi:hypothetical protein